MDGGNEDSIGRRPVGQAFRLIGLFLTVNSIPHSVYPAVIRSALAERDGLEGIAYPQSGMDGPHVVSKRLPDVLQDYPVPAPASGHLSGIDQRAINVSSDTSSRTGGRANWGNQHPVQNRGQ
jgi:hypothetical protein